MGFFQSLALALTVGTKLTSNNAQPRAEDCLAADIASGQLRAHLRRVALSTPAKMKADSSYLLVKDVKDAESSLNKYKEYFKARKVALDTAAPHTKVEDRNPGAIPKLHEASPWLSDAIGCSTSLARRRTLAQTSCRAQLAPLRSSRLLRDVDKDDEKDNLIYVVAASPPIKPQLVINDEVGRAPVIQIKQFAIELSGAFVRANGLRSAALNPLKGVIYTGSPLRMILPAPPFVAPEESRVKVHLVRAPPAKAVSFERSLDFCKANRLRLAAVNHLQLVSDVDSLSLKIPTTSTAANLSLPTTVDQNPQCRVHKPTPPSPKFSLVSFSAVSRCALVNDDTNEVVPAPLLHAAAESLDSLAVNIPGPASLSPKPTVEEGGESSEGWKGDLCEGGTTTEISPRRLGIQNGGQYRSNCDWVPGDRLPELTDEALGENKALILSTDRLMTRAGCFGYQTDLVSLLDMTISSTDLWRGLNSSIWSCAEPDGFPAARNCPTQPKEQTPPQSHQVTAYVLDASPWNRPGADSSTPLLVTGAMSKKATSVLVPTLDDPNHRLNASTGADPLAPSAEASSLKNSEQRTSLLDSVVALRDPRRSLNASIWSPKGTGPSATLPATKSKKQVLLLDSTISSNHPSRDLNASIRSRAVSVSSPLSVKYKRSTPRQQPAITFNADRSLNSSMWASPSPGFNSRQARQALSPVINQAPSETSSQPRRNAKESRPRRHQGVGRSKSRKENEVVCRK